MKKSLIAMAAAVGALALPGTALADWYIGAKGGLSIVEDTGGTLTRQLQDQGENNVTLDIDSTDTAGTLFVGYDLGNGMALEIGGFTLGDHDTTVTGTSSNPNALAQRIANVQPRTGDGILLSTRIATNFTRSFEGRMRVGFAIWDYEADIVTSSGTFRLEDDGLDGMAGIGLWFKRGQFAVGADFDIYNLNSDGTYALTGGVEWYPQF